MPCYAVVTSLQDEALSKLLHFRNYTSLRLCYSNIRQTGSLRRPRPALTLPVSWPWMCFHCSKRGRSPPHSSHT